jgi:medium-chain acyl-[acyl-carrier-protein] hydrolase
MFVCGRLKDVIISEGRKIVPSDIEWTALQSHPRARSGAAAFSREVDGAERVSLALEVEGVERADLSLAEEIGAAVREAITREHDLALYEIDLVPRGALYRTSSGKLERAAIRDALGGALPTLAAWRGERGWTTGEPRRATGERASWIACRTPRAAPQLRLFCFHHAGGGALTFQSWPAGLPPSVEVCPVQLPGREDRMREPPFRSMPSLLDALAAVIAERSDRPFAFFGHSMGGRVAFDLARTLRRRGAPGPVHLFLSAVSEPSTLSSEAGQRYLLPDAAFEEYVLSFGGIPLELRQRRAQMARLFELLRADLELNESATFEPEPPLSCPLTIWGGRVDALVREHNLRAWRAHAGAEFAMELFDGGHFYLVEQRDAVLARITAALEPHVAAAKSAPHG